jgi:uncharacterized tellurite resistance protein B-like protein
MRNLARLLGLPPPPAESRDTETVRRIARELERLPPDEARRLAAFAYVLARVANADLRITETETDRMLALVREHAGLSEEEAALAVEIAKSQTRLLGGTENYVVTREFREVSTPEERAHLLDCLFAVSAADESISTVEDNEIVRICAELQLPREEVVAARGRYRQHLAVLKKTTDR